jgi:hypothetical protein
LVCWGFGRALKKHIRKPSTPYSEASDEWAGAPPCSLCALRVSVVKIFCFHVVGGIGIQSSAQKNAKLEVSSTKYAVFSSGHFQIW